MAEQKQPRKASLSDFQRTTMNVVVELADGEEVEVTMKSLSYAQYNAIRWSVLDPTPQPMGIDPNTKRPMYDYNDPSFRRQVAETEQLRMYKLILATLDMDIPGDSEADKLHYLQEELDAAIVRQLIAVLNQIAMKGEARIAARAAAFQNGHDESVSDARPPSLETDAAAVGTAI